MLQQLNSNSFISNSQRPSYLTLILFKVKLHYEPGGKKICLFMTEKWEKVSLFKGTVFMGQSKVICIHFHFQNHTLH